MADYETIPVKGENVKQSHMLIGRISKIGRKKDEEPNPGKADVSIEGKGLIKNVEIFYHCENSDKAKGTETLNIPFREKDWVIVINHGDVESLNPDDMRIIGFKDGLPRYCTTQVIYVKQTQGWDIQKCFVWDVEKDDYAVIKDNAGNPIVFPCDARDADIVNWQRKQIEVSRQIFAPAQTCGKARPSCPEESGTIEEPASCGLHNDLTDVCRKNNSMIPAGEPWPYGCGYYGLGVGIAGGGWYLLYHTPFTYDHNTYVKNHTCEDIGWHSQEDSHRYLQSYYLPAKELKQDGYWRVHHEYTDTGHSSYAFSTGVFNGDCEGSWEIDYGQGTGHRTITGKVETFSHFCDESPRELNYSVVWSDLVYTIHGGPNSGTITITDWPRWVCFMGQARCSNKVVANIVYTKHITMSMTGEIIGPGAAIEYGERTYKGGIDITAQADFYPNGTEDVKVRELKRNLSFEQAVRNMDAIIRNLIPEPAGPDDIKFILPSVQIYEICRQ